VRLNLQCRRLGGMLVCGKQVKFWKWSKLIMADLTAEAWERKYQESQDPWDLGCPAPPFINLLASDQAPKPGKIAVLGCGGGHDALLFAMAGFEVVGFGFAPSAIERAAILAQERELNAQFLQRNIFDLATEFPYGFDYVLEHTCFCAIDPKERSLYVQVVKNLLCPNGQFIALFFTHGRPDGPPFGVKPQEVLDEFNPYFDPVLFQPAQDSIERRQGEEHLAIFRVR
jgi:methyl halide transferase